MKRLSFVLALLSFMLVSNSTFAQKEKGYTVKSKVTVEGTTDPNVLSQIPSDITEYLLGHRTKQISSPQEGVGITELVNGDAKEVYTIFDIVGLGKGYLRTTEVDMKELLSTREIKMNPTGEKKTIAGYECEKVEITLIDLETDDEAVVVVYVNKELCATDALNFKSYPGLEGYVMRTETEQNYEGNTLKFIQEVYEVTPNKKIKSVDFLLPADAVDIMQSPQWKSMLGVGAEEEEEE